ncbi:DNA polymerase I [Holzapfeliella sp. He02]|uniref:DNA polymerase I n=1 Tax=Holzapfeliella saturejae TaxID=3082953 RepID=A0ABU8SGY6_9LACO
MSKRKKLLLIDGNSLAYRAFYALYNVVDKFVNNEGLHTSAIYNMKKMLDSLLETHQPDNVLVAFDAGKTTFRTDMFSEYKGTRAKTPPELLEQLPYIREMLDHMGLKWHEQDNYEADDIIGTLAKRAQSQDFDVVVVTGDKDLTQLADTHIQVDVTVKGVNEIKSYTPAYFEEELGIKPLQLIDMKALMGDNSDNYPGVTKIGEKTALKLIQKYGSVKELYHHVDEMKKSKMKENLINEKKIAFLCYDLATIKTDTPIDFDLADTAVQAQNSEQLVAFYQKMNFKSFLDKEVLDSQFNQNTQEEIAYTVLNTEADVDQLPEVTDGFVAFQLELFGQNYHEADFVGFSLSINGQYFVSSVIDLLTTPKLQKLLESTTINKRVFDVKRTIVGLRRLGITLKSVDFDMLLVSYLLNPDHNQNDLGELAQSYNCFDAKSDVQVYGKGAKKALPEDEMLFEHLARKVRTIESMKAGLMSQLTDHNQDQLFDEIELPLAFVLAEMEIIGIKAQASTLQEMSVVLSQQLQEIEARIYAQAGEEFNINSPKQLGQILFEKLNLPPVKKTKTGYSTSVDVLETLKKKSPIVSDILDYRQVAKIQSTYVNGLLKTIHPDQRIHTRYLQTLTATGRLSSVDPNLQNIPIRLEEGRKIRHAFVPSNEDSVIFSSDYSQVELRVLAHMSEDENMQEAFKSDYDIHSHTAMKIFNLSSPEEVDSNMRRQAKAVNFGIVYGISDYGLAKNLDIPRKQAQAFIDQYFAQYPKVKQFMDDTIEQAKSDGYVETLMHRRRYLPDIHSRNFHLRSFAERTAMNSPIQGTAADIIKIAMINMQKALQEKHLRTKMLLQVHDELIFEVPQDELAIVEKLVPQVMTSAIQLDVPLVVDSSYGKSWYEAK